MFTVDSFGSNCPDNWEEIVDYLNDKIDPSTSIEEIWELYCADTLEGAPKPIFN